MIPPNIAAAASEAGLTLSHLDCEGAAFHSPTPLTTEAVSLVRWDWKVSEGDHPPAAALCDTCQTNLMILLKLFEHFEGEVPWPVRREFGNTLRALAKRGWEWYVVQPAKT